MAEWALIVDNKEVVRFRSLDDEDAREGCEDEAIDLGYAARLEQGFALVWRAEIVRMAD